MSTDQDRPATISERYDRAAAFLPNRLSANLRNTDFEPVWIKGEDRFWYRREITGGYQFVLVDAPRRQVAPAFDHKTLANALTLASGTPCDPARLPFMHFTLRNAKIRFDAFGASWVFDPADAECRRITPFPAAQDEVASPDFSHVAFQRDHNLWLRDSSTGAETQLTHDGCDGVSYAKSPDCNTATLSNRQAGVRLPVAVVWSPDSRALVTHKLDERDVPLLHLLQSAPKAQIRPKLHSLHVAFPGDAHIAMQQFIIIDTLTGRVVPIRTDPICALQTSSIELMNVWWSMDGRTVFLIDIGRTEKTARLLSVDAETGQTRVVLEEFAQTYLEMNHAAVHDRPLVRDLNNGDEILWFSQRDGWGHLYLYDGHSGALKTQVTSGRMLVRAIHHVDAEARTVVFCANGPDVSQDPYHRALFRIGLDGQGLQRLTPDGTDQHVMTTTPIRAREFRTRKAPPPGEGMSESGKYFVASASAIDTAQCATLYRNDGTPVMEIDSADISAATALGWRAPEAFVALAADGETEIHGALWKPRDFDPAHRYPVLDFIYPGPQRIQVPKRCFANSERMTYCLSQALAELGIIVIAVDGRGTPFRSKAFHDAAYGTQDNPGNIDDHIAAIRHLAAAHPYIDLTRVGMLGHSGGALASAIAILRHPDFFRAAICSSGNYDYRGYNFYWGEKYMGPMAVEADGTTSFDHLDCTRLAGNLKGKLLLGSGDMDDNVHCFQTHRLAKALIEENMNFDQITIPNANHETIMHHPYWQRKMMDFLTQHLVGGHPPEHYDLTKN
jgi:dipeptidyl aminopeptidase/acylaminoacyl peptidase